MSKDYWKSRSAQREMESQIIASRYLAMMDESLRKTQQEILRQIERFYSRYSIENRVSITNARKYLTVEELKDFKNIDLKRFREMSLADNPEYDRILNATSYRVRISRLEALNLRIEMQMAELYGGSNGLQHYSYTGLADVYQNSYYKTMFDLAKEGITTGVVAKLSDETMKEVLSYNWSGKEFSTRIWGHQETTRQSIRKELERSFASGRSIQRTTKAIMDKTDVAKSLVEALVRTEANFFNSLAAQDSYSDADIEKYEVLATLDSRTSNICREQDGKKYKTKDYKPGETAPPFHVRCRSTTIPYFDESEYMEGEKKQSADGLIDDMTYDKWYDKYVTSDPERLMEEKAIRNKYADKKQYEDYRIVLGKEAPRSLAEFQQIKYNDSNKWHGIQDNYYVKSRLKDGRYGSTINPEKQAPHMESTKKDGKSYFYDDVDVQELFDKYAGTGKIERTLKGIRTNKETIMTDTILGYDEFSKKSVKGIKIHHSKNRTHIVPFKGRS